MTFAKAQDTLTRHTGASSAGNHGRAKASLAPGSISHCSSQAPFLIPCNRGRPHIRPSILELIKLLLVILSGLSYCSFVRMYN